MGIHQMLMIGGKAAGSWIGDRGLFGGSGSGYPTTQYISIPTTGNASTWGYLNRNNGLQPGGCCAHDSRAIWMGGAGSNSTNNNIEYMSFSTNAQSSSGGTLNTYRANLTATSSKQGRGVSMGGRHSGWGFNEYLYMDYVDIATIGSASSFGNISARRDTNPAAFSNGTIGCVGGGYLGGGPGTITIDYITFATTSNSSNFGNLLIASNHDGLGNCQQGSANATVGFVYGGTKKYTGYTSYSTYSEIGTYNMVTTGNGSLFGSTSGHQAYLSTFGNKTRGVFGGGQTGWPNYQYGSYTQSMWYIDYSTTQTTTTFGTLSGSWNQSHVYGNGASNKA